MIHNVILYDQSANLAMVLTLLMPGYRFAVIKDRAELKEEYDRKCDLFLVVDQPNATWVIPVLQQLREENKQLKSIFLAKKIAKLQKWKTVSDIILCDWEIGEARIQRAITGLISQKREISELKNRYEVHKKKSLLPNI